MIDYSGLNPEQREAVLSDHPRILCLAGAGSGKTQVLTRRMARLWEEGINPENICLELPQRPQRPQHGDAQLQLRLQREQGGSPAL